MTSLALVLASLACGDEPDSKPPPKKVERADPDRIQAPHHSPQEMAEAPVKVRKVTASGKVEADIRGERRHYTFLPAGMNMAAHNAETGISRITLTAAEDESGYPKLVLRLDNVKLDELELPATFTAESSKKDGAPQLSVKLYRDDTRWWEAPTQGDAAKQTKVTIAEREDKTVRGTFEGFLEPRIEDLGEPVQLQNGTFEIELKHLGVSPASSQAAP